MFIDLGVCGEFELTEQKYSQNEKTQRTQRRKEKESLATEIHRLTRKTDNGNRKVIELKNNRKRISHESTKAQKYTKQRRSLATEIHRLTRKTDNRKVIELKNNRKRKERHRKELNRELTT
ncbi:MAG: hypothetical protein PHE49_11535 [bacterium]|nr:hypothetical protein [bacterium]